MARDGAREDLVQLRVPGRGGVALRDQSALQAARVTVARGLEVVRHLLEDLDLRDVPERRLVLRVAQAGAWGWAWGSGQG